MSTVVHVASARQSSVIPDRSRYLVNERLGAEGGRYLRLRLRSRFEGEIQGWGREYGLRVRV